MNPIICASNILKVSKEEENIIVGSALGDMFIQKGNTILGNCRLRFGHTHRQSEYVQWKYNKLIKFCETVQPPKITLKKGENNKIYEECRFHTSYLPELKPYHNLFYKQEIKDNGKVAYVKHVPEDIGLYLTLPIGLMVWFLDDGTYRTDCESGRIATQGLSYDEQLILVECVKQNFGIKMGIDSSTPSDTGKTVYGLTIPATGGHWKKFTSLISDFVIAEIPSMSYKVKRDTL